MLARQNKNLCNQFLRSLFVGVAFCSLSSRVASAQSSVTAYIGAELFNSSETQVHFNREFQGRMADGSYRLTYHDQGVTTTTIMIQTESPFTPRNFSYSMKDHSNYSYTSRGSNNYYGTSSHDSTTTEDRQPSWMWATGLFGSPGIQGTPDGTNFQSELTTFHQSTKDRVYPVPQGGQLPDFNYDVTYNRELITESTDRGYGYYVCKLAVKEEVPDSNPNDDSDTYNLTTYRNTKSNIPSVVVQGSSIPSPQVVNLNFRVSTMTVPFSVYYQLKGWGGQTVKLDDKTYVPTVYNYTLNPTTSNGALGLVSSPNTVSNYLADNTCRLYYWDYVTAAFTPPPRNLRPIRIASFVPTITSVLQAQADASNAALDKFLNVFTPTFNASEETAFTWHNDYEMKMTQAEQVASCAGTASFGECYNAHMAFEETGLKRFPVATQPSPAPSVVPVIR